MCPEVVCNGNASCGSVCVCVCVCVCVSVCVCTSEFVSECLAGRNAGGVYEEERVQCNLSDIQSRALGLTVTVWQGSWADRNQLHSWVIDAAHRPQCP